MSRCARYAADDSFFLKLHSHWMCIRISGSIRKGVKTNVLSIKRKQGNNSVLSSLMRGPGECIVVWKVMMVSERSSAFWCCEFWSGDTVRDHHLALRC
jgi:hypothetical protein